MEGNWEKWRFLSFTHEYGDTLFYIFIAPKEISVIKNLFIAQKVGTGTFTLRTFTTDILLLIHFSMAWP